MATVKFKKLSEDCFIPVPSTDGAAGWDVRLPIDIYSAIGQGSGCSRGYSLGEDGATVVDSYAVIYPGRTVRVNLNFAVQIPIGTALLVLPRSGLSEKGITLANSPGLVDSDFRGNMGLLLRNQGQSDFRIEGGMRIAQFVLVPFLTQEYVEVDSLDETERSEGGFGSTGLK